MSSRKNPEDNSHWRRLAIAAAFLFAQGRKPAEIAGKLKKGKSDISKLLKFAKEHKYLSGAPAFLRHNINDADWIEVERLYFGEATFTESVAPAAPPDVGLEAHVMFGSYAEFIHGAAVHVCHLLKRAKRVGLMWGRTVHLLVENIKACGENLNRDALGKIECVPLCGDPVHLLNQRLVEYSASRLALEMEEAIRRPENHRDEFPCLIGVPAYLSIAVRDGASLDDKNWVNFLHQIPGYERILGRSPGPRKRLADTVDMVITGAGINAPDSQPSSSSRKTARPDGPSTGDLIEERLQQEGAVVREKLPRLIYGDIGGVLLPRPGLNPEDQRLVDELNAGWTGLRERDLQRIARAATKDGAPGIVVVASSAAKGELLYAAIKRGLVNQLAVDEPLKQKLKELAA